MSIYFPVSVSLALPAQSHHLKEGRARHEAEHDTETQLASLVFKRRPRAAVFQCYTALHGGDDEESERYCRLALVKRWLTESDPLTVARSPTISAIAVIGQPRLA
jgi:hypothetical protein